jgi:hypothetical protein
MLLIYETGERPAPGTPEAAAIVTGHRAFEAARVEVRPIVERHR